MFSPETLEFIAENCWQSSRDWFSEHRKEYMKFVRNPMIELSDYLASTAEEIDINLKTDPRITISRINRDLRFAHGGSIYRDVLWISFRRDREEFNAWPELYFILSPKESFYGCGYYQTKAPVMAQIRKMVIEDHPKYISAKAVLDKYSDIVFEGDMYKRSKFKEYSEEKRQWLDRRNLSFSIYPTGDELFGDNLGEKIKEAFKTMKPIYEFLVLAEEEARKS